MRNENISDEGAEFIGLHGDAWRRISIRGLWFWITYEPQIHGKKSLHDNRIEKRWT